MKRVITFTALSTFVLSAGFVASQDVVPAGRSRGLSGRETPVASQPQDENVWMKAKQHNSHAIFDGLTEGDFDKVTTGTTFMLGSGVLEQWMADRDYVDHYAYEGEANAFDFALEELLRHSEHKDIDGALNAYVAMSQTCVRCHTLIRDRKPN